ncbi:MAG: hypothetical protein NG784_13630 [Candidatus Jettenia sp.]|nr:hypothetical protein [Candidatus Jettenia sp.]
MERAKTLNLRLAIRFKPRYMPCVKTSVVNLAQYVYCLVHFQPLFEIYGKHAKIADLKTKKAD